MPGETARARACQNQVEADARQLVLEASARARSALQSMEALLRNLVQLKTPVNIVMISEGMFVARDRSSMTELGRRAAEARATIHIIRPGQSFFDIEDRGLPSANSRFFDDALMSEGLEQVAAQTRGSMTTVTGNGMAAFDRLGRELSGYYLIGFEPTEADRTGKERRSCGSAAARPYRARAAAVRASHDSAEEPSTLAAPQHRWAKCSDPLPFAIADARGHLHRREPAPRSSRRIPQRSAIRPTRPVADRRHHSRQMTRSSDRGGVPPPAGRTKGESPRLA